MILDFLRKARTWIGRMILSVPVRWKIIGIGILPVIIFGFSLNYWITTGLSDWLSYILTDVRVEAAMAAGSRSVLFITIIAAFLSIILLALLVDILDTPLEDLRKTAKQVAAGDYEKRAEVWADDEIGSLALSVNQMIDNLIATQEDLSLSNQQLAAINRIVLAANQYEEIHDVLYIMLENLVELCGAEMGWVYLYDPEVDRYHLATWNNVPESIQQLLLDSISEPVCECQKMILSGNLQEELRIVPCKKLAGIQGFEGKSSHLSLPIKARNVWFGVINIYGEDLQELNNDMSELLTSIGSQISESVAKAYFQIKLREKEAARQLLLESLVSAQEDERSRLARELHDQAGQTLTNLLIRLKTVEKRSSEKSIKSELSDIQQIVSSTIEEVRDLSYSLRPPSLEQFGLASAIEALADEMTRGIRTRARCVCRCECDLPPEIEVVLYRIVQEGLTNIIRHAQAETIKVELDRHEQIFMLKIEDDGIGFDPAEVSQKKEGRHLGLISMNERTELLGGTFNMYSELGKGTTIEIRVPVPPLEAVNVN